MLFLTNNIVTKMFIKYKVKLSVVMPIKWQSRPSSVYTVHNRCSVSNY